MNTRLVTVPIEKELYAYYINLIKSGKQVGKDGFINLYEHTYRDGTTISIDVYTTFECCIKATLYSKYGNSVTFEITHLLSEKCRKNKSILSVDFENWVYYIYFTPVSSDTV